MFSMKAGACNRTGLRFSFKKIPYEALSDWLFRPFTRCYENTIVG